MTKPSRCGYVAIIGRPNVGKSTLLNHLLGQKLSITSRKPQTTRHNLLGIDTHDNVQIVYVDTPGLHQVTKRTLNRKMNKAALTTIQDVDIILFLVDATRWTKEDDWIVSILANTNVPTILVMNKIDKLKSKDELLPRIENLTSTVPNKMIIPVSAKLGDNVEHLQNEIMKLLPEGPHFFSGDDATDRDMQFQLSEIVREKIFRSMGDEVPYSIAVIIEKFALEKNIYHVAALIYVERMGQKKMLIGKGGDKLKQIGQQARLDMEPLLEKKVFLQLWVKVKPDWPDNESMLKQLGYSD